MSLFHFVKNLLTAPPAHPTVLRYCSDRRTRSWDRMPKLVSQTAPCRINQCLSSRPISKLLTDLLAFRWTSSNNLNRHLRRRHNSRASTTPSIHHSSWNRCPRIRLRRAKAWQALPSRSLRHPLLQRWPASKYSSQEPRQQGWRWTQLSIYSSRFKNHRVSKFRLTKIFLHSHLRISNHHHYCLCRTISRSQRTWSTLAYLSRCSSTASLLGSLR